MKTWVIFIYQKTCDEIVSEELRSSFGMEEEEKKVTKRKRKDEGGNN
jgi:hypothetical protein